VKQQPRSLETLLDLGADLEARDDTGLTPLDQAALSSEHEMAERLIAHGARVELPAAIALGRRDDIDRLLRDRPYDLRPGGRWERLIIRAAEKAKGDVIEALIKAGASVHVRDEARTSIDDTHGCTALHAAAWHGNVEAIRVLLRHGADPAVRESKYWGTPVGWANFAGRTAARDALLEGAIDIFDAIEYGRVEQIAAILSRDPAALERRFGRYITTGGEIVARPGQDPAWTPIAYAVVCGNRDAVQLLIERGADLAARDSGDRTLVDIATACGHADLARSIAQRMATPPVGTAREDGLDSRVAEFLLRACLDWRVGGAQRTFHMHDAGRALERTPELARANLYTAVACGELDEVRRVLRERPEAASGIGGPRSWAPLLYLCTARLPGAHRHEHSVEIATLLLDHGADPNVFYPGGNADIHYTALTCVLGRGEEAGSMHPRAKELARLLLERGADPHDNQVVYNVFADNTSRHLLTEDIVWLLALLHEHSVRRGHQALWDDPTWPMFDLRGAASLGDEARRHHGAHLMLSAAIDRNLPRLAEWMLEHGAGPDTPWGTHPARSARATLYEEAVARGHDEIAQLLVRHGATPTPLRLEGEEQFVDACLRMDRDTARHLAAEHPDYLRSHHALYAALEGDRDDVVALLLDLGVSPDAGNPSNAGETALHLAAAGGAERSAELLIRRGATVDSRERAYGGVPLSWASYFQQAPMIELLGRYSRDVWSLTRTGRLERLRVVLREEPALAQLSTSEGHTPLMWLPNDPGTALEIAALLLEHGADPSRRNAQGDTAADIATRRGLDQVAAMLLEHEEPG
jgi:ankyrin repeat protein